MNTKQLQQAIKKLPPLPKSKRFTWTFNRQDLRNKILNDNPEQFLTWPIIRQTMFVGNAPYIEKEMTWLLTHKIHNFTDEKILFEPKFGNPELWERSESTSGNFIHQMYHLMTWEQTTKLKIKDLDTIIDFGGGYGVACLLCRRLGFKGDYIIVDFPEFNLLQGYYLSNTIGIDNTYFIRTNGKLPIQADLLIATHSLSEAPILTRDAFISNLAIEHHLIAYQPVWDNIDNMEYFASRFQLGKKIEIEHLGHWYSIL